MFSEPTQTVTYKDQFEASCACKFAQLHLSTNQLHAQLYCRTYSWRCGFSSKSLLRFRVVHLGSSLNRRMAWMYCNQVRYICPGEIIDLSPGGAYVALACGESVVNTRGHDNQVILCMTLLVIASKLQCPPRHHQTSLHTFSK